MVEEWFQCGFPLGSLVSFHKKTSRLQWGNGFDQGSATCGSRTTRGYGVVVQFLGREMWWNGSLSRCRNRCLVWFFFFACKKTKKTKRFCFVVSLKSWSINTLLKTSNTAWLSVNFTSWLLDDCVWLSQSFRSQIKTQWFTPKCQCR